MNDDDLYPVAHAEPDPDDATQARTVHLMLMRWRGEREVSPWEGAVFRALQGYGGVDGTPPLTDEEKQFLDFLADQAVRRIRADTTTIEATPCRT